MKISPARTAAFDVLMKVETERGFSSVLLPAAEEDLSQQDRGLCHEIVLGVLRRRIYLDKIIEHFTRGKKLDTAVRIAVRIGLYQLLYLDKVPAYSALNESVNLVQRAGKTSAKGLVNAVLRRVSRSVPQFDFTDEIEKAAVETSHPRWLLEKWIGEFGEADAIKIANVNNEIPKIAFRQTAKVSGSGKNSLAETTITSRVSESNYVEGCFLIEGLLPELLEMADRGEFYFQDEASQMVAAAVRVRSGERFLDVCAAPGSKTTMIAANAQNATELLVAGDINNQRVRFLRENCIRQGVEKVLIVQYDAEQSIPFADYGFDVVLVDAPCSGTGTIRHNPEIRYFVNPEDFTDLFRKQLSILKNASKLVKVGGRLIYSTCSLEVEENEHVCRDFMAGEDAFTVKRPSVPERFHTADGFARTFPHRDEMDGFFIGEFERAK